jgi:hypothetical protein
MSTIKLEVDQGPVSTFVTGSEEVHTGSRPVSTIIEHTVLASGPQSQSQRRYLNGALGTE